MGRCTKVINIGTDNQEFSSRTIFVRRIVVEEELFFDELCAKPRKMIEAIKFEEFSSRTNFV